MSAAPEQRLYILFPGTPHGRGQLWKLEASWIWKLDLLDLETGPPGFRNWTRGFGNWAPGFGNQDFPQIWKLKSTLWKLKGTLWKLGLGLPGFGNWESWIWKLASLDLETGGLQDLETGRHALETEPPGFGNWASQDLETGPPGFGNWASRIWKLASLQDLETGRHALETGAPGIGNWASRIWKLGLQDLETGPQDLETGPPGFGNSEARFGH